MYKSFYNIVNTDLCLETPAKEVNDFCDYMWQEFPGNTNANDMAMIKVLPCADIEKCFSIYKNEKVAIDWGIEQTGVPYQFLTKALENIVSGHAINQVDKKEMITLHAGAVSHNDNGILISGESGNGKSTLTLELVANHNWNYLTDEISLLDPGLIIHPFLKTISCKRTGIVKIDEQWSTRHFGDDNQVAVPKEKHSGPTPLKAIFFVKYLPDKEPAIEPLKKSEALVRLLNSQIGRAKSVATLEQPDVQAW